MTPICPLSGAACTRGQWADAHADVQHQAIRPLSFDETNRRHGHGLEYLEARLDPRTADLAAGFAAVCIFVNDDAGKESIERLADVGVRVIALVRWLQQRRPRRAAAAGITVVRVPPTRRKPWPSTRWH